MSVLASGSLRGSAVLIIWGHQINPLADDERDLNDWWTNEHIPERLAIPGFHRARRYYFQDDDPNSNAFKTGTVQSTTAVPGQMVSHYMVMYEAKSLATLTSPEYMHALNNPTAGTKKHMPTLGDTQRSACKVLLSVGRSQFSKCTVGGVGGTMAHVLFTAPAQDEARDELMRWFAGDGWQMLQSFFSGILSLHVIEHDEDASSIGDSSQSYANVSIQSAATAAASGQMGRQWMLLVEFAEAYNAPCASYKLKCKAMAEKFIKCGVDMTTLSEKIYGLVIAMEK